MGRAGMLSTFFALILVSGSWAQEAGWRFRWQAGQALHYRVEHNTTVTEVTSGNKVEVTSRLVLLKRWEVAGVNAQGVADLRLTLLAMRHEQVRPNGETVLFDSANLDKSTPELRDQMRKFLGQTLAMLRIDPFGKVVEVKQGQASKYDSEPPFLVRLPAQAISAGQGWEREYDITLDPPLGTGEKYRSSQRFRFVRADGNLAVLSLSTSLKNQPASVGDRIPLLQKQPEGEIYFNMSAGRLEGANLRIDKAVEGHQGQGSSYRFSSTYREQYVDRK